ncbi:WD domain, G-beta repeat protein [Ancylostoma ceylanicum]|uniref:WD domain, G-beta repeat protein n=1 Tax=Ancylostoma ceylanicum TaxID=53326 RepID=A0A0D6LC52_9BILA|nr:WD domain, G-beta repeat protein [Ancylostoma ceylanicum]
MSKEVNEGEVYDVLWLSTDVYASGGSDKRLICSTLAPDVSFRSTLVGCNNAVTRLDFDSESRLLLGASNDHGVRLWNVDNQRLVSSFMGHTDRVSSARFLSTHQVVSGSNDRLIKLWDVRSQRYGVHVLCSTRDDTLSLMDVRKYQTVHIYRAPDGNIFVWNIQSTKLEKVLHKGGHE